MVLRLQYCVAHRVRISRSVALCARCISAGLLLIFLLSKFAYLLNECVSNRFTVRFWCSHPVSE